MYISRRDKVTSGVAAIGIVLLIAGALVFGLQVDWSPRETAALTSVDLTPPRPEPEQEEPPVQPKTSPAPKDAASPPNRRNQATEVTAPPQPFVIVPPPIVVATEAGTGNAATTGASDRAGPGRGAGGVGDGTGGGGTGGDGTGGGAETGPERIRGRLSFRDIPESLLGPGETATVDVRYAVETNGRVTDCRIDRSSGKPALDARVCQLIERRFRFRPARDAQGRPVRSTVVETHNWTVYPE